MLLACTGTVSAATLTVGSGETYTTIGDAINAASNGDTILVSDGTYGTVSVIKEVNITSINGSAVTTISSGSSTAFDVTANNVTINGFSIVGSGSGTGLYVYNKLNCSFINNNISNVDYGVRLDNADNNTIFNNTIYDLDDDGVYSYRSDYNNFTNNIVENGYDFGFNLYDSDYSIFNGNIITNNDDDGIYLYDSDYANITFNILDNNDDYGIRIYSSTSCVLLNNSVSLSRYGIQLESSSNAILENNTMSSNYNNFGVDNGYSHTVGTSNLVDGKPIYYWAGQSDAQIPSDAGQVYVISSTNITVRDLVLSDGYDKILFYDTHNSTIENVTVSRGVNGVRLQSSNYNTIANSTFGSGNNYGLFLDEYNHFNNITNNTANSNTYGIYLWNSERNLLENNTMTSNNYNFGVDGVDLPDYINFVNTSNILDGKPIYYLINQSNVEFAADSGYVCAVNCTNMTVTDLSFSDGYDMVFFAYTNNSLVDNVTFTDGYNGVRTFHSYYNEIHNVTGISNDGSSIFLDESNYFNNISLNNLTDSSNGIRLYQSSNNEILRNNATSGGYGINLEYSSNSNNVTYNNLSSNSNGIYLSSSDYNELDDNNMNSNSNGIYLYSSSDSNDVTNNTITFSSSYGIYLYSSCNSNGIIDNTISSSSSSGMYFYSSCNSNEISDNNITSSGGNGIYFYSCSLNDITGNNLTGNNNYGVFLNRCSGNEIIDNIINSNTRGIYFDSSSSNLVDDNRIIDNTYEGVTLYSYNNYQCNENTVSNNTITGNRDGVYTLMSSNPVSYSGSCDNNGISQNNISDNSRYGIYSYSYYDDNTCDYNSYTNNIITGNSQYGIYLYRDQYATIENNTISDNSNHGVYLLSNQHPTIEDNTISDNLNNGIFADMCEDYSIADNTVSGSTVGVYDNSTGNSTLLTNTLSGNVQYGFYSNDSLNLVINNQTFTSGSMEVTFDVNSTETSINGTDTNSTALSGKENVFGYLDINSSDNMTISFFYNDSAMSNETEATLDLYKFVNSSWVAVSNTSLNTSLNTLSVNISDFGTFGLFKDPEPTTTTTTTTTTTDDGGVRASVSQGQDPSNVATTASSVKRIVAGLEVNYVFTDSGTPVLGVSFDAKDDKGLVVAKVQVLRNNPDGVPSPSGNSYQMMSIDVGSEGTISSDSADNVMISFKVSKQWIEENNIDVSTIRMTRYHDDQWNDLPTTQESEDGEYFYFHAQTPGFSVFNVVGDEITASSEQVVASESVAEDVEEPVGDETPDTPGFTAIAGIVFVSLAVLLRRK
ncbi:MAG: hypothetical protein PWQ51_2309 [Methanolobus sp.]|jgi:PGF-pre-PGF domain-containing protein|uniref:right-handed parallel beta-helix repeat-containing protein n=1 Tax=Methanolobus sp. TaxID=1874737 RepID=UPI0024AA2296|nr:right-handed parallel beta-helix repeat-containing protein [Methanolobus sp.]MDI3485923.1 hypothetical protein [Methanolobus sp.]MDK2830990.1 hypothetical protein [Methanolobus sp.]MDK2940144.1 hypothetical protein [Methanolobus sp.]